MCYGKNTHKKKVPVKPVEPVRVEPVKVAQPRFEADVPKILQTNLSEQGTVYQPNPEIVPLAQVGDFVPAQVFYSVNQIEPITPMGMSERMPQGNAGLSNNPYYNDGINGGIGNSVRNNVNNVKSEFNNVRSDLNNGMRGDYNNVRNDFGNEYNNGNTATNNMRNEFNDGLVDARIAKDNMRNNISNNVDAMRNNVNSNRNAYSKEPMLA